MPQPRRYTDAAARQRAYRERQHAARRAEQEAKGLPPAPPIPTMPSQKRWDALIAQARLALETAHDEMHAYHDARSDAWQQGERGASMAAQIATLERLARELAGLPARDPDGTRTDPAAATTPPMAAARPAIPPEWEAVLAARVPARQHSLEVELWLRVENNSKFVRGKTKVRAQIEQFVLSRYRMRKRDPDGWEYVLTIPYDTEEDLEHTVHDILREADRLADGRHCFIEADVMALDGSERSW
jgi:hypothetical protein